MGIVLAFIGAMPLRTRLIFAVLIVVPSSRGIGQELNFGVHLNPVVCVPLPTNESRTAPELRMSPATVGYSYGLGASFTSGRLGIEAGASVVGKRYVVRQSDFATPVQTGITAKSSFAGASIEIPVLLKYNVGEHTGRATYSTHLLFGASYELFNPLIIPDDRLADSAASGEYQISIRSAPLPDAANLSWPNLIAGAQIRAVLRGVGLIEYGLTLHVPLQSTGPYTVETTVVESGRLTHTFRGEFYPRLAHLGFRIRYCFLNFKKGEGHVRYRG